jgi:hypothetical protein
MSSDASERASELLSDASDSAGDSDSDYSEEEATALRQRAVRAPAPAAAAEAAQLARGADGSGSEGESESEGEDGAARENALPQLTEYELERAARIEANKKRLAQLVTLPAALHVVPPAKRPRAPRPALQTLQAGAVARGSARLRGEKAPVMELDEHDRVLDATTVATTDSGEARPLDSLPPCFEAALFGADALPPARACSWWRTPRATAAGRRRPS